MGRDVNKLSTQLLFAVRATFMLLLVALSILHGAYLLTEATDVASCFNKLVWMAVGDAILFTVSYLILRAVLLVIIKQKGVPFQQHKSLI